MPRVNPFTSGATVVLEVDPVAPSRTVLKPDVSPSGVEALTGVLAELVGATIAEGLDRASQTSRASNGGLRSVGSSADRFSSAAQVWTQLVEWVRAHHTDPTEMRRLALQLTAVIGRIDQLLSDQVNALLHHPRFQQLEASWRGLHLLLDHPPGEHEVAFKILNVTKRELFKDLDAQVEFDQSALFRKVYDEEFGQLGGEPFGVLLGDYAFTKHPEDIDLLEKLSGVAAAAFAPFIGAAHPDLLTLSSFAELQRPLNLERTFEQPEYTRWRSLRKMEDSRFLGLVLPHVLLRLPWPDDGSRTDGFRFREDTDGPDASKWLWGNAIWGIGRVLSRAHATAGWLADAVGVRRDPEGKSLEDAGGLVTSLPAPSVNTDRRGLVPLFPADICLTDLQERGLSELGLIPLIPCKDTSACAFYSLPSLQKAKVYTGVASSANARLSSMLQYVLCASRFAHYLKVMARDRTGSFASPDDLERLLHNWLATKTTADSNASPELKAKFPLREAEVKVFPRMGHPGVYDCTIRLMPHFQFDEVAGGITLRTELRAASG